MPKPKGDFRVICPNCQEEFQLQCDSMDDKPDTFVISSCDSGGIYAIYIQCPHCDYKEEMW